MLYFTWKSRWEIPRPNYKNDVCLVGKLFIWIKHLPTVKTERKYITEDVNISPVFNYKTVS